MISIRTKIWALFSVHFGASFEASTILVLFRGIYLTVNSIMRHNLFLGHRGNFALNASCLLDVDYYFQITRIYLYSYRNC